MRYTATVLRILVETLVESSSKKCQNVLFMFSEMASLLMGNGILVKTTLLRMIELGDTSAVSMICKNKNILKVSNGYH